MRTFLWTMLQIDRQHTPAPTGQQERGSEIGVVRDHERQGRPHCFEDTFELRRLLEPYAARRAASEINAAELAELRKAIGRLRKLVPSGKASLVAKTNRDIRRLLFGVSRNASLAQAIDQLSDHVYLLGILTLKDKSVRALLVVRHESIFKALSTRDERAVEKAVMDYLAAAHRSVTAALAAVDSRG